MTAIDAVNFRLRHVAAIGLGLGRVEGKLVLAPDHEQPRLGLAQPRLPRWIRSYVGTIVIKQIGLDIRLSRLVQKVKLIGPQIRIMSLYVRIVADMTSPGGC